MRIVFLPSSYLPESVGGTELYVHNLAIALTAAGHQIAIVYHSENPGTSVVDGYEVHRLPPHKPKTRADLYLNSSRTAPPGFDEFLQSWQPDLVHFHALTFGAGLGHCEALRKREIRYYVTYHTPTFSCLRGTLLRWGKEVCAGIIRPFSCAACYLQAQGYPRPIASLMAATPLSYRWLPDGPWVSKVAFTSLMADRLPRWQGFMEGASHIVACAQWCAEVLVANGVSRDRISVHRQALPGLDRGRNLRLPLATHRPLRLGFFGRFTWMKGPDILLQAARVLADRGLLIRVELVGPIPPAERAWADKLLAEHASYSTYLGVKRDSALVDWIDGIDLMIIPSRCLETGPLTLLEAWDRGVPVAGTNHGGIKEFVAAAGLGSLLFEQGDPNSLADAIQRAAQWPAAEQVQVSIDGMKTLASQMEKMYLEPEPSYRAGALAGPPR